ncbi:MAG: hypothetical protein MJZ16_13250, partial [Bacteroidales bacterium]|nr:hypothetical protein [Bacteroidales bacterium]
MSISTVIFNLSGVYEDEGMIPAYSSWEDAKVVDLTSLDGTVCYCDDDAVNILREEVSKALGNSLNPSVCWIDSGDYHYMSYFRAEKIDIPFQLILIDHHPDMQEPVFGDVLSCGGWLRTLLNQNPHLLNVKLVGVNPSLMEETEGFPDRISDSLRDDLPVFVSIDKDVLSQEYSRTNWDQGDMTFEDLVKVLEDNVKGKKILGVDICGERPSSKGGDPEDMA